MNHFSGSIKTLFVLLFCFVALAACNEFEEDVMPLSFGGDLKIHPDDLYVYNNKTSRVHSEANDTIVSFSKKTYSTPKHGTLIPNFDGIEGTMGYRPNPGFVGKDSITYEVCSGQTCKTAKIRFFVEEPLNVSNCTTTLGADFVATKRNTPKGFRIHLNDIICPSNNISVMWGVPANGTIRHIEYFEGWKNQEMIYTPKRGFVGQDSFKYKVYPNGFNGNNPDEYLEVEVKITVE